MITYPTNKLQKVLLAGKCQQGVLPDGYTQVEYIESNGTAWLDTGFIANNGMIFDGKVMPVDGQCQIGSIGPSSIPANNTRNLIAYGSNGYYAPQKLDLYSERYSDDGTTPATIHLDTTGTKYYCTVNGNVVVDSTNSGILGNQTTTVKIGFSDYSQITRKGRYYPLKFRNSNGDLVCDLIPAKNSSNVVSMYDLVSDTFLPVQGTDVFIAGPDVVPTPDEPIGIVCNNGVVKYGAIAKNLYNPATRIDGYYISSLSSTVANEKFCYSALIPVKPNTTYVLSGINYTAKTYKRLHAYDSDGNWLEQLNFAWVEGVKTNFMVVGTTTAQTAYIRISIARADANIQVEEGVNATSYKPYQAGIYTDGTVEQVTDNLGNTANAEMLLGVGDYKDVQSVLDGKVTRNVGIKVLDGTENWLLSSNGTRFYLALDDCNKDGANAPSVCNYFTYYAITPSKLTTGYMIFIVNNIAYIQVAVANFSFTTLNEFKDWLADQYAAGTPVIIVYPLATPTTEQVTPQPLAGNSVTQTAGSIDNLPIESSTIAELKKRYIGDREVKRVYIGDNLVWEND